MITSHEDEPCKFLFSEVCVKLVDLRMNVYQEAV